MIPVSEPYLGEKELNYITDCIKTGWISSRGGYIKKFEQEFASFCNTRFGIAVSNGTAALHLALKALNIKEGDEVIVPNLTFVSPASMVKNIGAVPILVDSDPETWNMDVSKIEEKITPKTKAIIPVHLYGHPCDMNSIMEIAKKHSLYVIEDACEAHGAEYNGKKVGGIGDIGCFSFYGNKVITTGEGGMIVTNREDLKDRVVYFMNHGMRDGKRYWHEDVGFNYRMTNLQAAVGLAQLERIQEFIEIKRENANYYNLLLKGIRGITLPAEKQWAKNIYWMYSILIDDCFGISRDELIEKLKEKGIDSRAFFYPLNEMPPYKNNEELPVSKKLSRTGISLPSSTKLKKEEIKYIADSIKSFAEQ